MSNLLIIIYLQIQMYFLHIRGKNNNKKVVFYTIVDNFLKKNANMGILIFCIFAPYFSKEEKY